MKNNLVKNAVIIALGGFFAKLLGAFYRIPLLNIIGSEGIGLYQMVFPVYCMLLDFSTAGIPSSLSKLIGGEENNYANFSLLYSGKKFLSILGIIGSIVMIVFSKKLAILQGNEKAYLGYIFLAPSVFFVSILSSYRGFFQGYGKMFPTAFSQIIEQLVKLILGLSLAYYFIGSTEKAVAGATFAITISEIFALIYLSLTFRKFRKKNNIEKITPNFKRDIVKIIKICLPITITSLLLPFSQTVDSFLIINILSNYLDNATSLYGLLSGAVTTVINLPVSLIYGIAVAVLPLVSKSLNLEGKKSAKKISNKSIFLTLLFSTLFAILFYLFRNRIIDFLFHSLKQEDRFIAKNLLRIMSVSIIFLSFLQTSNSILVGLDKQYFPIISLSVGITVKIVLNVILLKNPYFNIYGGAISITSCYFVAGFLNLLYYLFINKKWRKNYATKQEFTK